MTVAAAPAGVDLKQERLEHLQLFNLFGDPTMRLGNAKEVKISAPETAAAGQPITIQAECHVAGTATVVWRGRWMWLVGAPRDWYDGTETGRGKFDATYQSAIAHRSFRRRSRLKTASLRRICLCLRGRLESTAFECLWRGPTVLPSGGSRVQIAAGHGSGDNSADRKVADRATDQVTDPAEHRQ